ncbi:hypothetical protein NG798_22520 [Ancylothrix sp. C2]|uniref:hypothetical protein n=1 Tax=Ancylothrix sp. D3o TaxID=2953691 RepID=UPI0021BADEF7|nr:hypothetical protein [Ancylothrix sp. D3o]MCT7952575.1 hypothetical protein [Ancylothrix sp. D3o]
MSYPIHRHPREFHRPPSIRLSHPIHRPQADSLASQHPQPPQYPSAPRHPPPQTDKPALLDSGRPVRFKVLGKLVVCGIRCWPVVARRLVKFVMLVVAGRQVKFLDVGDAGEPNGVAGAGGAGAR